MLIRRDLTTGQGCAQIVHAAGESAAMIGYSDGLHVRFMSLDNTTVAVVLGVRDEKSLKYYAKRLDRANVAYVAITESAGPLAGQMTAIGVLPTPNREVVRAVLKKLQPISHFSNTEFA